MNGIGLIYDSDSSIIEAYVETQSRYASNAFVNKYRTFVFSIALRYVPNHLDADDIAQEAFIKALTNLHKFNRQSSLKTWLYKITVNQAINFIRKKKLKSFFTFSHNGLSDFDFKDDSLMPDQIIFANEFDRKFQKALTQLPEKQRETFALRYFDELTYEEISAMVGTSVGGLKANYHQAVKKLTKLMEEK